jgi:hypothetical protein
MINYIRKDNEKYKNNVMKNKISKCWVHSCKKEPRLPALSSAYQGLRVKIC